MVTKRGSGDAADSLEKTDQRANVANDNDNAVEARGQAIDCELINDTEVAIE